MSGNRNSGNRSGRTTAAARNATVAPRAPSEKIAKLVRDEKPLAELPPKPKMQFIAARGRSAAAGGQADIESPDGILNDAKADQRWEQLGGLLLKNGLLSELDLPALEAVVTQWRITDAVGAAAPKTYPGNLAKVLAGLKSLGLTKDSRIAPGEMPGAADHLPPGHPRGELYNLNNERRRRNHQEAG